MKVVRRAVLSFTAMVLLGSCAAMQARQATAPAIDGQVDSLTIRTYAPGSLCNYPHCGGTTVLDARGIIYYRPQAGQLEHDSVEGNLLARVWSEAVTRDFPALAARLKPQRATRTLDELWSDLSGCFQPKSAHYAYIALTFFVDSLQHRVDHYHEEEKDRGCTDAPAASAEINTILESLARHSDGKLPWWIRDR